MTKKSESRLARDRKTLEACKAKSMAKLREQVRKLQRLMELDTGRAVVSHCWFPVERKKS